MSQVDREDNEWRVRIDAYFAERNRLLAGTLPDTQRQSMLAQLQQGRFMPDDAGG